MYAHRFTGKRYDCGSKLGYLQATVEFGLGHPQLGKDFGKYLQSLSRETINSIAAKGNEYAQVDRRKAAQRMARTEPASRVSGLRRGARDPQGYDSAPDSIPGVGALGIGLRAVCQAEATAMRFHNLPAQSQSQACAGCLRRVERQQRIPQHALRQSAASIRNLNYEAFTTLSHLDSDVLGREPDSAAFFKQVDHHLFQLAGIEISGREGNSPSSSNVIVLRRRSRNGCQPTSAGSGRGSFANRA